MALYLFANGTRPGSSAPFVAVTTGTSMKTLLQLKSSETLSTAPNNVTTGMSRIKIKEWGISFDGTSATTPVKCELIETSSNATVTAATVSDIIKFDNYYAPDPVLTFSTSGTGYTSSNEGSDYSSRYFDVQFVAPTNQYVKQFPLGLEPQLLTSAYLRIRVTTAVAVNAYCYILFEQ